MSSWTLWVPARRTRSRYPSAHVDIPELQEGDSAELRRNREVTGRLLQLHLRPGQAQELQPQAGSRPGLRSYEPSQIHLGAQTLGQEVGSYDPKQVEVN